MDNVSILVVEDEVDIRELVRYTLEKPGFQVQGANTGEEGLEWMQAQVPDLLVLDLMLPGMDGLEVCRRMKQTPVLRTVPIVILTARGEEADVVAGLELGADDYITKPFSPRVLTARVQAVLRRARTSVPDETAPIHRHEVTIHPGRHEVSVHGKPVKLTYTEFRILHFLARRPGWVSTRYQIVDAVRGEEHDVTDRSVDVHIVALRRKLGAAGRRIETVRGVGYRFQE